MILLRVLLFLLQLGTSDYRIIVEVQENEADDDENEYIDESLDHNFDNGYLPPYALNCLAKLKNYNVAIFTRAYSCSDSKTKPRRRPNKMQRRNCKQIWTLSLSCRIYWDAL